MRSHGKPFCHRPYSMSAPGAAGLAHISLPTMQYRHHKRIDSDRMAPNAEPPVSVHGRHLGALDPPQQLAGRRPPCCATRRAPARGGVLSLRCRRRRPVSSVSFGARVPAQRCRVGNPGETRPSEPPHAYLYVNSASAREKAVSWQRGLARELLRHPLQAARRSVHRVKSLWFVGCVPNDVLAEAPTTEYASVLQDASTAFGRFCVYSSQR